MSLKTPHQRPRLRVPSIVAISISLLVPAFGYDYIRPLSSSAFGPNWGWAPSFIAATPPYNMMGVVGVDAGQGSGCAVARHIVLSCGHVLLDDYGSWQTGIYWDRLRTPSSSNKLAPAQSYVSSTYQSRLREGTGKTVTPAFTEDWAFLAFYDSSAGNGGWVPMAADTYTAAEASGSRTFSEIAGYPAGWYPISTDSRTAELHSTNPSMTLARWYRKENYAYRGTTYRTEWFYTWDLFSTAGNSGGPVLTMLYNVKHVSGIYVSYNRNYVEAGIRELTSSLVSMLLTYDGYFKSWTSTPVATVGRNEVKVNQTWSQVFSVGDDGRLQCTFFNGYYWQTYSLGGNPVDSGFSAGPGFGSGVQLTGNLAYGPFDIDPTSGMIYYISGGDVWVAYVARSGWAHYRVLDYGGAVTGRPVAVSFDPTYRIVGITEDNGRPGFPEANGTRRLLYFTGSSWEHSLTNLPAGRLVSADAGLPIAWEYKAGGGLVGRYLQPSLVRNTISYSWASLDVTPNLGGVVPGDSRPTSTYDGKLARFAGGLVYASNYSTLELVMFWYGYWTRVSLASGINSRSWVAADRVRSSIFCTDTSNRLTILVPGNSSWQKTTTSINSGADAGGAVIESWGIMFHANNGSLAVCTLQ